MNIELDTAIEFTNNDGPICLYHVVKFVTNCGEKDFDAKVVSEPRPCLACHREQVGHEECVSFQGTFRFHNGGYVPHD